MTWSDEVLAEIRERKTATTVEIIDELCTRHTDITRYVLKAKVYNALSNLTKYGLVRRRDIGPNRSVRWEAVM